MNLDSSKFRFELSNNATASPANLSSADGQKMAMVKTKPTQWVAYVSHPDVHECFYVGRFDTIIERRNWINKVKNGEVQFKV